MGGLVPGRVVVHAQSSSGVGFQAEARDKLRTWAGLLRDNFGSTVAAGVLGAAGVSRSLEDMRFRVKCMLF